MVDARATYKKKFRTALTNKKNAVPNNDYLNLDLKHTHKCKYRHTILEHTVSSHDQVKFSPKKTDELQKQAHK